MADHPRMLPVSVCIPVRNEETNLARCLAALTDFDEVVVVDSESSDRTKEIALGAGAVVLDFKWDGKFPKKRNWALRNHSFRHPWILFLDADEQVTPDFVGELRRVLPDAPHAGFWISFTNWFMGRPLRHGDVFRKLALFRIGKGEYECLPEAFWSALDMEVHEHPILEGTTGEIRSRIEHHDFRGLKSYLQRHNEYSSWEANRFLWLDKAGEQEWSRLNPRQRFKYRFLDRAWFSWFYWLVSVVIKRGFLDGRSGRALGRMKRRYFQEVRMKIQESRRTGEPA
jgi:glycosyltransferase involved in cell wall biosynthesis